MINVRDLQPKRIMDPYEPCWCESGKKWKWCHKNRESMRPPAFGELHAKMLEEAKSGICMHPDALVTCSDKLIKAHTVQKNGGLSAIADKGHVISVKAAFEGLDRNNGRLVPIPIGINNASTFFGFCSAHDSELFRPAEHNVRQLSEEVAFLLAYRAMAYEYFSKIIAERWHPIQAMADCGQPFERQEMIQMGMHWVLQGTKLAIQDFEKIMPRFVTAWKSKSFSEFSYFAVEFEDCLPIVGCGGFAPEYDFTGRLLQKLGKPDVDHIYFNWTVIEGRSFVVLAWLETTSDVCRNFVSSFRALTQTEYANAFVRLVFEHIENIYFRPTWWNSLSSELREGLALKLRNGTLSGERTYEGLLPAGLDPFGQVEVRNILEN